MNRRSSQGTNLGADYSDEEREFLVAVEAYKKKARTRFPALTEILAVLKSLGYRKIEREE